MMEKKRPPQEILVIDVESSCYGPSEPRWIQEIIQIGICLYDARTRSFTRDCLDVAPVHSSITPYCTALTGITPEHAATGMGLAAACDHLRDRYMSTRRLWASWGDYDRTQFQCDCAHNDEATYPFGSRHLNVKTLCALLTGSAETGMAAALEQTGLPLLGRHHDGGDDAYNAARLLDHLLHERSAS